MVSNPINLLPLFLHTIPTSPKPINGSKTQFNFKLLAASILNNNFYLLYKKFCPGPITFVLKIKKTSKISKYVNNKNKTLAVRFPKHKITQKLLNNLSYPIAAPSANIFSNLSPVSASDVKEEFGKKIKINAVIGTNIIISL